MTYPRWFRIYVLLLFRYVYAVVVFCLPLIGSLIVLDLFLRVRRAARAAGFGDEQPLQ